MKKKIAIGLTLVLVLTLGLVMAAPVGANPLTPDLVALWHLDEGSGADAYDSSGNGNNGTLTNMDPTTDWVSGKFGNALDFDGTNDYVSVPDNASLNITQGTWEAWLKFSALPSAAGHLMNPLAKQEQYWIHASSDDSIQVKVTVGGTRYIAKTSASFITTGIWYHVAGTYDGETLKLYVDGALEDSNTAPSGNIDTSTAILAMGTWSTPTDYFQGTIDEVRIWDEALGSSAILQSFELGGTQSETDVVVQLKHKVLTSGEFVVFTSAFYLGTQVPGTDKTVDIYIMSSSSDRTIAAVGLRHVTPRKTDGSMTGSSASGTSGQATVTNGPAAWKGKTSTSIHLYAELDTDELLGVNAQYLPWS